MDELNEAERKIIRKLRVSDRLLELVDEAETGGLDVEKLLELVRGIVRFGHSADGWTCPMCGLSSEQGSYYDARTGRRVGL